MRVYDEGEAKKLNAEQWQLDLLELNPEYVHWGNFEDYMWKDGNGWDSRISVHNVTGLFLLDELNECVHFYFSVIRDSKPCEHCEETGLNPATLKLSRDWYTHSNTEGKQGWSKHLKQVEVDALWESGRLNQDFKEKPTPEELNFKYSQPRIMGHDAINQYICVKARAESLGVYGKCEHCHGDGFIYTAEKAHVALQLWILHPRKGCSRGVYVENIEQKDLPKVMEYLREAANRNADRFSKIMTISKEPLSE